MELEVEVFGSFDPVQFEVFGPDYGPVLEITFKQPVGRLQTKFMLRTLKKYLETRVANAENPILQPLTSEQWQRAYLERQQMKQQAAAASKANMQTTRPSFTGVSPAQYQSHSSRPSFPTHTTQISDVMNQHTHVELSPMGGSRMNVANASSYAPSDHWGSNFTDSEHIVGTPQSVNNSGLQAEGIRDHTQQNASGNQMSFPYLIQQEQFLGMSVGVNSEIQSVQSASPRGSVATTTTAFPSFPPIPAQQVQVSQPVRQDSRVSFRTDLVSEYGGASVQSFPQRPVQKLVTPQQQQIIPRVQNTRVTSPKVRPNVDDQRIVTGITRQNSRQNTLTNRTPQPGEPGPNLEMSILTQLLMGYSISAGLNYLVYASLTEPGDNQTAAYRLAWTLERIAPLFVFWWLAIEVIDSYKLEDVIPENTRDVKWPPLKHLFISRWDNRTLYPFATLSCLLFSIYADKPNTPVDARLAVSMAYVFIIGRLVYFSSVFLMMPNFRHFGNYVGNLHLFFYGHVYCFYKLCT